MSKHLTPIDISNYPELLRLAEEVSTTKKPLVLTRDKKNLAVVMPVENAATPKKHRGKTKTDYEASLAAIGRWRDLDADALIAHVYRAREEGSRPATRP